MVHVLASFGGPTHVRISMSYTGEGKTRIFRANGSQATASGEYSDVIGALVTGHNQGSGCSAYMTITYLD